MRRVRFKGGAVILNRITAFLFAFHFRNKTLCILISYVILSLSSLFLNKPAYALDIGSTAFDIGIVTFLNGGGAVSSTNNNAEITAIGEGIVTFEESTSTEFRLINGLNLFISLEKIAKEWPIIEDLRAKTEVFGNPIPEARWQKDNDPYFYWKINLEPPELIKGFSISLDAQPDSIIDITAPNYQYPQDSINSGKHTFFVLPFTSTLAWAQKDIISFEIWVDVDEPIVNQLQPSAGYITSNNLASITCFLSDAHSGIDKISTTLSLNNQNVRFNYNLGKQFLEFKPSAPLSEGKNTVLLKAVDYVGNYIIKGWEFIVDTEAPEGSILINGGEDTTNSAYCSINIEAMDSVSGIKSIYLSNDGIFDTEMNLPLPYSPFISNWLLSAPDVNGLKTVYARFQDFAGNLSIVYKDQINLELRTPDTRIISGPPTVTENPDADFIYEASKTGCLFSYKLDDAEWTDWQGSNKANFKELSSGNHYFYVKSGFDLNGDGQITIDEEDATPAQWVWTIKPEGTIEKLREKILFWRR